jgi:DNA polymerase-3 subunit epsilon
LGQEAKADRSSAGEFAVNIIFLDLETTGFLDEEPFRITEIAWAIYDPIVRRIVRCHSALINELPENYQTTADIYDLTGLCGRTISDYGGSLKAQIEYMKPYMNEAMAIFARGGLWFDKPALEREAARVGADLLLPKKVWIDDYYDIEYPSFVKGHSLSHIAADHGFLNPFPHTAMGDVMTLITVMKMGGYDLEDAYESAKQPLVEVQALVSFDNKDLAKAAGFKWDGERKIWHKVMRQGRYQSIIDSEEKITLNGWRFKTIARPYAP